MLKSLNYLLVISTITFLFYCKGKDGSPGPKGDQGSDGKSNVTTGTSSGFAHLADEFGFPVYSNDKGIKVTLVGSSPEITVETDSSGAFAFTNVKTGTYDLLLKKDGFPDYLYKRFIIFEGPKSLDNFTDMTLSQRSTSVLSNLTVKIDSSYGSTQLKFRVNVSPSSTQVKYRTVLFVISNDPNVDIKNVTYSSGYFNSKAKTFSTTATAVADSAVSSFTINVNNTQTYYYPTNSLDFSKGKTIYCKAYGIARYDNNYYNNSNNIRDYHTASPNPSNTASITIN